MRAQELRFAARSLMQLGRELGLRRSLAATAGGAAAAVGVDPFSHLGPPASIRERRSRQQAGAAVLIYRALLRVTPPAAALEAMAGLIEAGALVFLARTLPEVSPESLDRGDPARRTDQVRGWMRRFFTATIGEVSADDEGVTFEVTACALVRLAHAAGHPELAPLFCKGDETFFALRGVRLERPSTIAGGQARCRFELTRA